MGGHIVELNESQMEALLSIQQKLHALPDAMTVGAIRDILEETAKLIGASRGFSCNWFDGQLVWVPYEIGPQIEDFINENFIGIEEDGNFILRDPDYDLVNRLRRQMGGGVVPDWELYTEDTGPASEWHRDIYVPAGMGQIIGMNVVLPVGESVMAFGFNGPEDPHYRNDTTVNLLKLIHPSYSSAFQRLYAKSFDRPSFLALLDALPYPTILRANDGEISSANAAADGLDWTDIATLDDELVFHLPGPNLPDMRCTEIVIDMREASIDFEDLAVRRGLTDRQAEVAECIAKGASDKEIALQLQISVNTARRHCEAVLDRLGVNSRSGVLFTLITGRTARGVLPVAA